MTKKFLKIILNLAIITAMNIVLISVTSANNATNANPLEAFQYPLDDVTPCVNDSPGGADANKIIVFTEEPLGGSSEDIVIGDTTFRRCFRNTFQFTNGKDRKTSSLVGKECSPKGQNLAARGDEEGEELYNYKPTFSCKEIQASISSGGTSLIYGYIGMIYRWGASIVGIIAVLVIVLSGIQLSAAGGDQEAVTKAKTRILQSISGIVVLFLSGLILYTINPNFYVFSP